MSFELTSPAFRPDTRIPDRFTGTGADVSPPLRWANAPAGTRSFVLVVDDPDAPGGTYGHWAMHGIPADWRDLPEDVASSAERLGLRLGRNDAGSLGYSGPHPPRGHGVHHYHFRLGALDVADLRVDENARVEAVWRAATPHLLGVAELVGVYERK